MRSTMHFAAARRRVRVTAAGAGLVVVLAACGGATTGSAEDLTAEDIDPEHNEADAAFAQQMIPHHEQAVMMSSMAEGRSQDQEILDLASEIQAAQEPEIDVMNTFLEVWEANMGDMGDMDMGDMDMGDMDMGTMPGMMDESAMGDLESLEGTDFDRMFLQSMVAHHEGAIEMAQVEIDEGENPQAVDLAGQIIDAQEAEIEMMEELLAER